MFRCAFILFLLLFLSNESSATKDKVLVLHSYHQGLKWTDDISLGILEVFKKRENVELHFEYLDTKRNVESAYMTELTQLYEAKLNNIPYKVIIVSDNNAFDFVKKHRNSFFKGIPVIFTAINDYSPAMIEGMDNITGIAEAPDFQRNIEEILLYHKNIHNLIIINDNMTKTGQLNRKLVGAIEENYRQRVKFRYFDDFSLQQLRDSIKALHANDVVLLLTFNQDVEGHYISYRESMDLVRSVSSVPVYSVWDFFFGEGIVGGYLVKGKKMGSLAGVMAIRVLDGEAASDIPVMVKGYSRFMFDWRYLSQYGIKEWMLPAGKIIINRPPGFVERYKVLIFIAFLLVLLLFIGVAFSGYRRYLNERRLKKQNDELDRRVVERTHALHEANKTLEQHRVQIENQNHELEKHRHHLLDLVEEKTLSLRDANKKLKNSRERLIMMLDVNSDGVWEHNLLTNMVHFSDRFWERLGYDEALKGTSKAFIDGLIHPVDLQMVENARKQYIEGQRELFEVEFRVKHKQGFWKWILAKGKALNFDDEGRALELVGTHIDITLRKNAQEERRISEVKLLEKSKEIAARNREYQQLNEALIHANEEMAEINQQLKVGEKRWRSLVEQAVEGIVVFDSKGLILDINPTMTKWLGYEKGELLNSHVGQFDEEENVGRLSRSLFVESVDPVVSQTFEYAFRTKQGDSIPVEAILSPLQLDEERMVLMVVRDIRERQAEERRVLNAIIDAEEQERKRISKDLHDSIGPLLSSIRLFIEALKRSRDEEKRLQIAEDSLSAVDEAIGSVREISNHLSPQVLSDFGLLKAIDNFVQRLKNSGGLDVLVDADIPYTMRFDQQVEIVLYRVISELINNTIRHAGAGKVAIGISYDGKFLTIHYKDDGQGFDPEILGNPLRKGIGLSNILSRLKSVHGTYQLMSKPGEGMQILIVVELLNS